MDLSAADVNEEFTRRNIQPDAFGPKCRKFKDTVIFLKSHNFPEAVLNGLIRSFMKRILNEADTYISDIPETQVASMGGNHESISTKQIWAHIKEHTTGETSNSGVTGETFRKHCLIQQDRFIAILRKPQDDHLALTKSKVRLMTSQIGTAGRPQKGSSEEEEDFVKRLNAWKKPPPQLADDILSIIGDKLGKMSLRAQGKKTKKKKKKKKKKTRKATKKRR